MRSILGSVLLGSFVSFGSTPAPHDVPDLPPKVVSSIRSVQHIATEQSPDRYVLLLRNNSAEALSRLEWTTTRDKEHKSGAFTASDGGPVAPGSLFDVVIPRIKVPHEEPNHEEEELKEDKEAHRQTIVLEAALFVGGEAEGNPTRASLAPAHEQGSIGPLPARAPEGDRISVALASVEASAGGIASVMLRFTRPEGSPAVQRLRASICFPGALLQFDKVYLGQSAEAAGTEIKHNVTQAGDCTRLTLEMNFGRAPESGMLAGLDFLVDESASIGQKAELASEAELTGAQGRLDVLNTPGVVKISEPSKVFACFFYMH